MKKFSVNKFMNESGASSDWPSSLLAQHTQLEKEIDSITTVITQEKNDFFHIEAQLRKLTKGLLIHIELEACFFTPMLDRSDLSLTQKNSIIEGYSLISTMIYTISDYFHARKLECGTAFLDDEQIQHIKDFLVKIKNRLSEENAIYLGLKSHRFDTNEV